MKYFKFFQLLKKIKEKTNIVKDERVKKVITTFTALSIFLSVFFIFFIIIFQIFFINWEGYGEMVARQISEKMKANIVIKGRTNGSLIPGYIALQDIYIEYNADDGGSYEGSSVSHIDSLYINFNIFNFLFKKVKLNKFSVSGAVFNFSKLSFGGGLDFIDIYLNNCTLVFGEGFLKREMGQIDGHVRVDSHKIDANISFLLNNDTYKAIISSSSADKNSSNINARVEAYHIAMGFEGVNKWHDGSFSIAGKFRGQGDNLIASLNKITEGRNANIFGNYSVNERYFFDTDLSIDENKIKMENFKLHSDSIGGQVDCNYSFGENNQFELAGHIDKLDLDTLKSKKNTQQRDNIISTLNFKIPKNISGFFSIKIDSVKYKNTQIKNVVTAGDITGGEFSLYEMRALMPGESNLFVSGRMIGNEIRPRFDGVILVEGKDAVEFLDFFTKYAAVKDFYNFSGEFSINSKLILAPYIISFVGLNGSSATNTAKGSVRYKWGGKKQMIVANIDINNIDISKIRKKINSSNIRSNLSWLADPGFSAKIDFKVDDLFFDKNKSIHSPSFIVEIYENNLVFKNLKLSSPIVDVKGDVRIVYDANLPVINARLSSSHIDLEANDDYIFNSSNSLSGFEWSNKTIDLSVLQNLRADFDLSVDNIKYGKLLLYDTGLKFSLIDGNLIIKESNTRIGNGKLTLSGYLGTRKKLVTNFAFSLADAQVSDLTNLFNLKSVKDGYLSISGSLKTSGSNMAEMARFVSGNVNAALINTTIVGVDFDGFADTVIGAKNKKELKDISEKSLYSGETFFKSSDFKISLENGIGKITGTGTTRRTGNAMVINVDMSTLLVNGIMRLFFIPIGVKEKIASDLEIKGFIKYPVRSFNMQQLEMLVFRGISPVNRSANN